VITARLRLIVLPLNVSRLAHGAMMVVVVGGALHHVKREGELSGRGNMSYTPCPAIDALRLLSLKLYDYVNTSSRYAGRPFALNAVANLILVSAPSVIYVLHRRPSEPCHNIWAAVA